MLVLAVHLVRRPLQVMVRSDVKNDRNTEDVPQWGFYRVLKGNNGHRPEGRVPMLDQAGRWPKQGDIKAG